MLQQQGVETNGVPHQTRIRSECPAKAEDAARRSWCGSPKWPSPSTLALVLAVISLLVTAHSWGGQSYVTKGMLWMKEHEQQGRVWFVVAYTACLLLLLPASVLALLAGACFGLLWGVALVYLANIIGQTLAFLLARSYLHDRLYDLVTSHWPQFTSIDAALRREGWRLVFVLRLSPCVPFVVLNYALGLTSISFLEYSLASAVAIIPFVVISVYLGLASGTALQLLENTRWANQPDRPLINPQSTHSGSKSVAQQIGAHMFSPPPAPPHGHLNAALSTAAATAESTGMYRDGDSGMEGASTTFVTIATCILAVVTALYAAWFIRRVTSEVLEEESCERVGSAGGLVGLSLFADSSIQIEPGPHRDVHGDASPPASTSSVSSPTLHAEKREAVNGAGGWQSPLRAASGPFQAALPRDTSQAVNGEGEQLIHAGGKGSGRHSRESSISSMHSSLQQRWPRWTGDLARNVAQAARTAVGVSMLPVVYTGDAQHSEASTQLVGLDKR